MAICITRHRDNRTSLQELPLRYLSILGQVLTSCAEEPSSPQAMQHLLPRASRPTIARATRSPASHGPPLCKPMVQCLPRLIPLPLYNPSTPLTLQSQERTPSLPLSLSLDYIFPRPRLAGIMSRVLGLALLLLAGAMSGEAQSPAASPAPSKSLAATPPTTTTTTESSPVPSPKATPAPDAPSPTAATPSAAPTHAAAEAPAAQSPSNDGDIPDEGPSSAEGPSEAAVPPSPPSPAVSSFSPESAPTPSTAEDDAKSGSVSVRSGAGAVLGGLVAAWVAVSAF